MTKFITTLFIMAISLWTMAQCLAPIDADSEYSANPEDEINGVFKFDYRIESTFSYHGGGSSDVLKMDYYVNSADGSILFPSGPTGFFNTNMGMYQSHDGRIDGAVWLPNGQMVTYVYDADNAVKRAITRETSQTTSDRFSSNYLSMMQFFSSSAELAEHPEPLPAHFQWDGPTQGYKGELVEAETGLKNTWIIYFDAAPTPIKTSTIMMGFMVGVLKDTRELQCNRLAVYTKVYLGGESTGDFMQIELVSIRPMGITFDATEYKPMILGGDAGTDIKNKQAYFQGKMMALLRRKETLQDRRKNCGSDHCRDNVDLELEQIQEEEDKLNCEMARAMGMDDLLEGCN